MLKYKIALVNVFWSEDENNTRYFINRNEQNLYFDNLANGKISPFVNFNIAKHSYWEKSVEDINTFLSTGSFPEYVKPTQEGAYVAPAAPVYTAPAQPTYTAPVQAAPVYQAPVNPTPVAQPVYQAPVTPAPATPVTQSAAQPATAPATERPARNFGGFSF